MTLNCLGGNETWNFGGLVLGCIDAFCCVHASALRNKHHAKLRTREFIETWMKSPSNFERLVLGCIDSYDSESRRIFQDFSRSTRFTFLCTAQTSKFQEKTRPKFCRNETFSFSFSFSFQQKSMNFVIFLLNFDEILSEFHEKFQEITKVLNILRNSARKIRKMLEISGICEKFHFFEWKFQWTP